MAFRMPRLRLTRRFGKILLAIAAVILILFGVAAWQVPKVLRSALTDDVSGLLGRPVQVGKISFNPFTLTVRAHDLSVAQPGGAAPLLDVGQLDVSASWMSLFWFAPVVDSVRVQSPRIALVREDAMRFNFSDIQQKLADMAAAQPEPEQPDDSGPPRFSLNNLVLEDGSITLDDQVTGRKQQVDQIALGVPFISTFGYATDIDVQPRVHMRINGSPFDLHGVARPFDVVPASTLNVAFQGLELEKWADAWPAPLPIKVERALLDSDLQIVFEQPHDAAPQIKVVGDLGLRQLDVREASGESLIRWSTLDVRRIALDPIARQLSIGQVELWSPMAQTRRDASQRVNWLHVIDQLKALGGGKPAEAPPVQAPPAEANAAKAEAAAAPPAQAGTGDTGATAGKPASPPAPPADGWRVSVDAVNINDAGLRLRDAPTGLDYTLAGMAVTVENVQFPQPPEQPINLWLTMDNPADGGWIRAKGPLRLSPLALDLDLQAGHLGLAPFAAAVRSQAPVQLLDGLLGVQAQVKVAEQGGATQVSATGVKAEVSQLAVRDESVKPAVDLALGQLTLAADRLALDGQPSPFTLQASGIQGNGQLALQGTLTPQPLALQTQVDLQALDLATLAPYVASSLNANVRAVTVGARGQAAFAAAAGGAPLKASWQGAVDVTGLDLADRVNRDDFLKWKRLGLEGMQVSVDGDKFAANLGDITLDDFYGRILLSAEGRLNVMDLVAEPGQAGGSITQDTQTRGRTARPPDTAGRLPDISVGSVTLKSGRMTFTDRFVKPNYTAELSRIEGGLSAVSSRNPKPAKVKVTGRVYGTAPLSISGSVQPFAEFLALDLKASAKGVDLPRFTTYSSKYVGYPIKRGKLSLDLEYKLKDRALQASNHVVLNQLTFGDKTNSPDATKLPVMLAVALLKDSRGNIDINLPISGSLDDPQFSVGGIIVRVLVNLVVKAVTSPFSLLASAFGGGEELSYINFEPGSAVLAADADERIATLAKALNDRPALKLDIIGRADPATDTEGLREAWVDLQIRKAKAADTGGRGKHPDPRSVTVSDAERAEYLEEVYDDTDIEDKPRNFIGFAKSVPAEQMETLLRQAAPVNDDDLRQLADARAQAVYEKLQESGPADRIFIVASSLDGEAGEGDAEPSRVDFALQ
ncbi:DUF748 domain-containing protein [Bordetella sp. BOR01]|uniref:DUF748 domain-containing protein n=1 Tax=Bordetella sp. BOR01 TaxID=2854779 RepID=UPI001C46A15E|nr:DUF748 domain-containing protein [Bordetella sp. BOR01]MBV7484045.1 DUF748 domain-containing protein [Bordetella sp. BOR01]